MELMDQLDNPKKVKGKNCHGKWVRGKRAEVNGLTYGEILDIVMFFEIFIVDNKVS